MDKKTDIPVITSATHTSTTEAFKRKRKYLGLMSLRIPALLVAMWIFINTHIVWLALLVVLASIPIPWIAVLIANDRPAQQKISLLTVLGLKKASYTDQNFSKRSIPEENSSGILEPVIIDDSTLN